MSALPNSAYGQLETLFRRLGAIGEATSILHWDASAMMPAGSSEARGEQLAALNTLQHEMMTSPRTADLIAASIDEAATLDDWQAANLREMRRNWIHATAVDAALVEARTKATMKCEMIWREARPKSDFAAVLPALTEVVNLTKQAASAKAAKLNLDPYDAMMDQYSPGVRAAAVDQVFSELAAKLPGMIDAALARQAAAPAPIEPQGPFAADAQRAVGVKFMELLGFDFNAGRLDISLHPFSGGTPDDLRITTRYDEDDFTRGLMGILHETGHALYEKGLPKDWSRQPVGEARGMDVHESQSLLIEMQVCRSPEFLSYAAPHLKTAFNGNGPAWTPENLARIYTRVSRSLIRVDADEMTYPLHVILRYRLERAIIGGDLALADLPGAWNDGMRELVGIKPDSDRTGCLQDIHWFDGAFGYFPSYTLGAMAAAQMFQAATRTDPRILPAIGRGDFKPLYAWLGANVHGHGCRYETPELIAKATGAPLSVSPFLTHLERRYLD
jgi:carboxypeptidase Taq